MSILTSTQDYNPLTWDIQLNPAAWWLSLKDINSAASVELKSSLYSGNLNLTADQYREVQSLVADKYSAIDVSGIIAPGAITKDWELAGGIDMTWKDPGLYMSNDRLWFYDGTAWQVWIGNNGDFFFGWDASNYIEWSGSTLTVKWDIEVADGSITAPKLAASLLYAWEIVIDTSGKIRSGQTAYDTGTWFWIWDVSWVKKFSIGNGTKWLKWDGSDLTIRGNIYAESGTFTGSITSTATITWGILQSATTWKRIVIESNTFKSYDSSNVLRVQTANEWMRITDTTWAYYADFSTRSFSGPWAIEWPYILVSDTSTPSTRVWLRTSFLAGHPSATDKSLSIYLDWASWWMITFRSIWWGWTSWTWVRLTSPDDDTLAFDWKKISFNWVILEKIGSDLYWNGVKIN